MRLAVKLGFEKDKVVSWFEIEYKLMDNDS